MKTQKLNGHLPDVLKVLLTLLDILYSNDDATTTQPPHTSPSRSLYASLLGWFQHPLWHG
jgi:hypothetical protein